MKRQISVIIPAHNEEDYLAETVRAFQKQTLKPLEIIVVCDACTDKTPQIAKKLGVKVIIKNYRNVSKTRNTGVKVAKGEILVIQDADSVPAENFLEKIAEAIANGITYGTAKLTPESTILNSIIRLHIMNYGGAVLGGFNGASLFVTRKAMLKTNLYDPNTPWAEDWDLCMQLKKLGKWKVLFNTSVKYSERRMRENGYWYEYLSRFLKILEYFRYLMRKRFQISPKAA